MKPETKMVITVVVGVLSAFLLLGLSYIIFPDTPIQQPPGPQPTSSPEPLLGQILWAIQLIGLAAIISVSVFGAFLLVNHVRKERTGEQQTE
jgi:hypothetical protein